MLEATLWDVDGVIVDSEEIYYRAVRETFSIFGVDIGEDEYVRRYMLEQTTSRGVIKDYGLDVSLEDAKERKAAIVGRLIDEELEMMEGARKMLCDFEGKYPMGVVSSAGREEVLKKLGKFDLIDMFRAIVTGDDVEKTKPDPEPYVLGVELMGRSLGRRIMPGNVVAVEDNPSGAKSAYTAGCRVIGFPNGFTKDMDFPYADVTISSLDQIDDYLLRRVVSPSYKVLKG